MIPFIACLGAAVIVLLAAQTGMKAGAWLMLCAMLSITLGALAALRYWFLVSRVVGQHEVMPVPLHIIIVFWALLMGVVFICSKLRESYTEVLESTIPSVVDRILGALFGLGAGIVLAASLLMTVSILAPEFYPAYQRDQLPVAADRWPLQAYQYIETRVAGIAPEQPGHTLLPALSKEAAKTPADFWK